MDNGDASRLHSSEGTNSHAENDFQPKNGVELSYVGLEGSTGTETGLNNPKNCGHNNNCSDHVDGDVDDSNSALLAPLVGENSLMEKRGPLNIEFPHPPHHGGDGHGALPPGTATTTQLVINIIISFVGAGLLGIPYAMQKSGWLLGSVCLLVVAALNLYSMLLLPQIQQALVKQGHQNCSTYGDLGRCILGKAGETLVNICLCFSQIGFATAYIIFIAANLYNIAKIPRGLVCLACIPGLCILVQFRELKHLSPFSLLANCSNFAALSAVLFQDIKTYEPHNDTIHAVKLDGLFYIIAITMYSFEGIGMVLSLEASCIDRSSFPRVLQIVGTCIALFMTLFGSAGYLAFGDNTMAPITLNLTGHWSSTFVKYALCLGLYLTYPIMMFPVWSTSENFLPPLKTVTSLRVAFRCSFVLFSAAVAYSFPNFGEFLSLVGSSICIILTLILPTYFSLAVQRDDSPYWKIGLNILLFLGAVSFSLISTFNSVKAILEGDGGRGPIEREINEN